MRPRVLTVASTRRPTRFARGPRVKRGVMRRRNKRELTFDEHKEGFGLSCRTIVLFAYAPFGLIALPWGALVLAVCAVMLYTSQEGRWYLAQKRAGRYWLCTTFVGSMILSLANLDAEAPTSSIPIFGAVTLVWFVILWLATVEDVAESFAKMKHAQSQDQLMVHPRREPHL
jgi:hypothetical protein